MRGIPWLYAYPIAGVAMVVNLLRDAHMRATMLCEMYPTFSFSETFQEELLLHHTLLPIVRVHVTTLLLLVVYFLGYFVLYFNVIEWLWLGVMEILSGRWLYELFCVQLPAYLPFLGSESGMPELLSDSEGDNESELFDAHDVPPVDANECNRAIEKLVQTKLEYANRTISRPDDWLVFDPVEGLVLQKDKLKRSEQENEKSKNGIQLMNAVNEENSVSAVKENGISDGKKSKKNAMESTALADENDAEAEVEANAGEAEQSAMNGISKQT